jgi:hypothetical protein
MPITRAKNKIIYFAHVPKCGGTTVEKAFENAGFQWVFHRGRWKSMGKMAYVKSMPTHISARHFEMLFPGSFIDLTFAVVRHPLSRFLSAFNYNRLTGRIPWHFGIDKFMSRLENSRDRFLFNYDNHFLTASEIIPQDSTVFRLEDGLEEIIPWLRKALGDYEVGIDFHVENKRAYNDTASPSPLKEQIKKRFQPKIPSLDVLSDDLINRVSELYKEDYVKFGYEKLP